MRAVRGQHQRKETVRTYSGWFGSTSRGAEQRSRSTRAVCAAAVTRGILSRVSGLADVVARECIVENRLLRSVRNGVERSNVRQKKGYKGACFRCSERATERGLRRTIQRSSRSRRSVRHASTSLDHPSKKDVSYVGNRAARQTFLESVLRAGID